MQTSPAKPTISSSLLLAIGFLVLLTIVVMTYALAERSRTNFNEAIAARDERTAAVELRNALQMADSSQRGFVLSGNEIYLAPFQTAQSEAERWLAALDRSAAANPDAKPLVDRLRQLTKDKLSEMQTLIDLKRARRDEEALQIFRSNRGKAMMDEANVFFSGLILGADDRLTAGVDEQRTNAAWLRWLTVLGGMIIVTVVGFAISTVVSHARDLVSAHHELADLNRLLEARVAARTAELMHANDEIQRFAYIVTHDLRAPLVNIMGFTSELEVGVAKLRAALDPPEPSPSQSLEARVAAEEDLPEAISFIRGSTQKMDALIKAILSLARSGQRSLTSQSIDLTRAVQVAASNVRHQVHSQGGEITFDIEISHVTMDPMALDQIVGNLLDNAVKYCAQDRLLTIKIRARPLADDKFVLEIEDNGRGIDPRDLERIFELFRRAGRQDQPGEGIGLASVKSLVRRLGGTITVKSVLDQGTIFTVVLPMAPTNSEPASK